MSELRFRVSVKPGLVLRALDGAIERAGNLHSGMAGTPPIDALHGYLDWTAQAERALRPLIKHSQVFGLLHTQRHWALRQMDGASSRLIEAILLELEDRLDALEDTRRTLAVDHERWNCALNLYVVDTNALYASANDFEGFDWPQALSCPGDVDLIVPQVVVDEMDRHKRSADKARRKVATAILRSMDELEIGEAGRSRLPGATNQRLSTYMEFLADPLDHQRLPDADSEIVDRALLVRERAGREVVVITYDRGMRVRTTLAGVATRRPRQSQADPEP